MIGVSLSFDDGRADNIYVANQVLDKLLVPATFNITTDYIIDENQSEKPCGNLSMSKQDVIRLSKNPLFEIAGHGKEHNNNYENLVEGVDILRNWCGCKVNGIASPNSKIDQIQLQDYLSRLSKQGVDYIRIGDRLPSGNVIIRLSRRLNFHLHSTLLNNWIYKDSFYERTNPVVKSIPIVKHFKLKEVVSLIKHAIKLNKSCVLMFHSILKKDDDFYQDLWTWDFDDFVELCKILKKMEEDKKILLLQSRELVGDN